MNCLKSEGKANDQIIVNQLSLVSFWVQISTARSPWLVLAFPCVAVTFHRIAADAQRKDTITTAHPPSLLPLSDARAYSLLKPNHNR